METIRFRFLSLSPLQNRPTSELIIDVQPYLADGLPIIHSNPSFFKARQAPYMWTTTHSRRVHLQAMPFDLPSSNSESTASIDELVVGHHLDRTVTLDHCEGSFGREKGELQSEHSTSLHLYHRDQMCSHSRRKLLRLLLLMATVLQSQDIRKSIKFNVTGFVLVILEPRDNPTTPSSFDGMRFLRSTSSSHRRELARFADSAHRLRHFTPPSTPTPSDFPPSFSFIFGAGAGSRLHSESLFTAVSSSFVTSSVFTRR
ncbi:hypothetical protein BLNAU_16733 [Blattamonas nauphoetae]|uniref:Uncharacterized protein n=1 Tax=Blattamonas nauphoetae TaxID=2049346 RepID=A0ABQ9XCL3_9EUKA|nr:hypothetical protein BLNAU_16733 [Blattamonas nauphoetae]